MSSSGERLDFREVDDRREDLLAWSFSKRPILAGDQSQRSKRMNGIFVSRLETCESRWIAPSV
jgi:hypothetical protein